jgi:hypothetical protein
MIGLDVMAARLSAIPCPICKQSEFFIPPAGDQSYAQQLYKARCLKCAYTFQISTPTKPIQQTDPDVAQWLAGLRCPCCHQSSAELDFRCMPSVRECLYFVTCSACRHPFHEPSPMEAYE